MAYLRQVITGARLYTDDRVIRGRFTVSLVGFDGSLELAPTGPYRVVILSRSRGTKSTIYLFSDSGALISHRDIEPEVGSATLVNWGSGMVPIMIVDGLAAWGTGVYVREWHAFEVGPTQGDLWSDISVEKSGGADGSPPEERKGFVNFERGAFGVDSHLTYREVVRRKGIESIDKSYSLFRRRERFDKVTATP